MRTQDIDRRSLQDATDDRLLIYNPICLGHIIVIVGASIRFGSCIDAAMQRYGSGQFVCHCGRPRPTKLAHPARRSKSSDRNWRLKYESARALETQQFSKENPQRFFCLPRLICSFSLDVVTTAQTADISVKLLLVVISLFLVNFVLSCSKNESQVNQGRTSPSRVSNIYRIFI